MMILLFVADISANTSMKCLGNKDYFEDPYIMEYVEGCNSIFYDCMDQLLESSEISEDDAYQQCSAKTLDLDSRFAGPCPKVLTELESVHDPIGTLSARALLRSQFHHVLDSNYSSTYKFDETKREMEAALSLYPYDIGLLTDILRYLSEDDLVLGLETRMRLIELDPDCEIDWEIWANSIADLVNQLVQKRLSETTPKTIHDLEKTDALIRRAWLSYLSIYDHAYETSNGLNTLSYGVISFSPGFFPRDDRVSTTISEIIGVSPTDFVEDRKAYVLSELLRVVETGSDLVREDKLGLVCNDYAFEIGLLQHCLKLINDYSEMDAKRKTEIPDDIYEATLNSLVTITRNCHSDLLLNIYLYEGDATATFCVSQDNDQLIRKLTTSIARYPRSSQDSKFALLELYSSIDESTPQDFYVQLELDSRLILHSLILAKRLHHLGLVQQAIEILDRSIEFVTPRNLDKHVFATSEHSVLGFGSPSFIENRGHSNQVRSILVEAKILLQHGLDHQIHEGARSAIGW